MLQDTKYKCVWKTGSSAHRQIRQLIEMIICKEFLLICDFNYRGIKWASNNWENSASVKSKMFLESVTKIF